MFNFIEILFMLWLPVKNFKFWHTCLVNSPKLDVALKLSPEGRGVKICLGDQILTKRNSDTKASQWNN